MNINVVRKYLSYYKVILLVCSAVLILAGCGNVKDIRPTSFHVESVAPKGLYAAEIDFKLGIHNPSLQVTLSDIFAEVTVYGKVIGNVSVAPFVMEAKSDKIYDMKALVALNKGSSILNLIPLLKDPEALKNSFVNVRVKASLKGGLSKELKWDGLPVEKLMKLAQ